MMSSEQLSQKLSELENAEKKVPQSPPKIQRVLPHLRNRKNSEKHFSPKLISFGPIHHGRENLKLGEQYKLMWADMYIKRKNKSSKALYEKIAKVLYDKIASNLDKIKRLYADDLIKVDDETLSWMLFVDGCALLQIVERANIADHEHEAMKVKVDQLVIVCHDALLLENQLPYQVLELLWVPHDDDKTELNNKINDDVKKDNRLLLKSMENYFNRIYPSLISPADDKSQQNHSRAGDTNDKCHRNHPPADDKRQRNHNNSGDCPHKSVGTPQERRLEILPEAPVHLLHQFRKTILLIDDPKNVSDGSHSNGSSSKQANTANEAKNGNSNVVTHRNIKELMTSGIKPKRNNSSRKPKRKNSPPNRWEISFSSSGKWFGADLFLPQITVDDTTACTCLNLIAFEMCPDFENKYEICSFIAFMDSLIDHTDDVKALRTAGVLRNALGSDEEVTNIFNTMSTDLVPDSSFFSGVTKEIEEHYTNKWKTWIALFSHKYFSNPWAFIGLMFAILAIVLSFTQVWYAANPVSPPSSPPSS